VLLERVNWRAIVAPVTAAEMNFDVDVEWYKMDGTVAKCHVESGGMRASKTNGRGHAGVWSRRVTQRRQVRGKRKLQILNRAGKSMQIGAVASI